MTSRHSCTKPAILLLCMATIGALAQAPTVKPNSAAPVLRNTCLITNDVARLVSFYSQVLGISANTSGSDYAEFRTGVEVLAIFSAQAQEKYMPGSATAANNKGVILEFEVSGDIDQEFKRLQSVVKDWVKSPTTQPWGTRSMYFRDPDGNLVNFFRWVKSK